MTELMAGSIIGPFPYRIIRRIGQRQGAMSDVYIAEVLPEGSDTAGRDDSGLDQSNVVVLKLVRVDSENGEFYRATLENEVERLRRLKHPGIVRIYPVQKPGLPNLPYMAQASLPGRPWFSVMEYLAGESLATLMAQRGPLEVGVALEIARSIAATLDYIHNLNHVHLDIKPENILFREAVQPGRELSPVLIDFGIARTVGQPGLVAGTLKWSPPERLVLTEGRRPPETVVRPHPSMDVYALGMLLYFMIAGRLPFESRAGEEISAAILAGNPTVPSTYQPLVKKDLDNLIMTAIAADPARRPRADELARALEELAIRLNYRPRYGYLPASNPSRQGSAARAAAPRSIGVRVVAVALGVIALLEGAFIAYSQLSHPETEIASVTATPMIASAPTATIASEAPVVTIGPASPEPSPSQPPLATDASDVDAGGSEPTSTRATTSAILATSTPIPIRTSTSTPELTPTATSTPTSPPTRGAAAARPTRVTPRVRSVVPLKPPDGITGKGLQVFSWQPNGVLGPDERYELVFWEDRQYPMDSGFGMASPTTQTSVTVDLNALDTNPNHPLKAGYYRWGILLVKIAPKYERLQFLGGGWLFSYRP